MEKGEDQIEARKKDRQQYLLIVCFYLVLLNVGKYEEKLVLNGT